MNEEIDEYDIYHQDFTTISEWEVFIARIEEVLNEWRLSKAKIPKGNLEFTKKWIGKSEEIKFQSLNFTLSYHTLECELNTNPLKDNKGVEGGWKPSTQLHNGIWEATKNFMDDEDGSPFPVSHWYGLKQYLMLYPSQPLVEENQIKLVMSSINIAFANIDCAVPFFLKIREHWQQCFLGIYEDSEFKTSFDTIHLKRIPNQCSHLNGLANLFKGKIASPVSLEPVLMSAKFSYELKDLEPFVWRPPSQTNEFLSIDGFDVEKLIELPFGAEKNPIQSALLNVMWPRFLENAVIDSASYSDFDPLMAPTWTITIKLRENINCLLSDLVGKMLDLLDDNHLLMDTLGLSRSLGILNPLHKITEAPITISKLVRAAMGSTSVSEFKGPIPDDLLMSLLYYIFPDAVDDDSHKYPEDLQVEMKQSDQEPKLCSAVKSSPAGGLVRRVSLVAARLLEAGGLPYLAHLWYEFTQELQYRWERRIRVPGVAAGPPGARSCLLHQKLQLLNCCIERAGVEAGAGGREGAGGDSDDEFYDCSEEEGEEETCERPAAAGRQERLDDAVMKNGAPLYIPKTQEPPPRTEDQVAEDAALLEAQGGGARGSALRARLLSASLLSDMEAFKAANPGAELCDFCRWYSPRDWRPEGGGALGERMLLPGNPWSEAWAVARPVPAARQRRLFDEQREAQQLLQWLRARTVAGVAELLLPGVLRAGAARASAAGATGGAGAAGSDTRRVLTAAARELAEAEKAAARAGAARVVLGGAAEGCPLEAAARARLLAAAGGALPPPARREFSLRVRDAGGAGGAGAPHVLRAALRQDLLLAGCFTEAAVLL
ncbi:hypothetical protein JYU34_002298 [Plutella xylostella]|uniref:Rab3 GTPase-activating protein catalytic subunit n=1 Tax=Plutella xylostella TaxID=51655 RepID=A0ABQ7R1U3_PLUXY|nr:hypothetical protein JYU34_002298 [Plutella xylostella]